MIIGISGKMHSGKDTLGKLIQLIDARDKGYKHFKGKEEVTDIAKIYESWKDFPYRNHGNDMWRIKKFGCKLKRIASILTGIPEEKFEDQEFKDSYLGSEWNQPMLGSGEPEVKKVPMKVRTFLQLLGTEAMRFGLHKDTWTNALFADYGKCTKCGEKENLHPNHNEGKVGYIADVLCNECGALFNYPNWIITDLRFPVDAKAVKDRGGMVIRINRGSGFVSAGNWKGEGGTHSSEFMLDNYEGFDTIYQNDGTIEELAEFAGRVLHNANLQK